MVVKVEARTGGTEGPLFSAMCATDIRPIQNHVLENYNFEIMRCVCFICFLIKLKKYNES